MFDTRQITTNSSFWTRFFPTKRAPYKPMRSFELRVKCKCALAEVRKDNPLFWKHFLWLRHFSQKKKTWPGPLCSFIHWHDFMSFVNKIQHTRLLLGNVTIWYWTMVDITEGPFKNDVTGVWGEGCHKCWIYCLKTSKLNSSLFGDKGGGGPTNETCLVCGVLNGPWI